MPKIDWRKSKLTQKMAITDFLLIFTFLFFITNPPHVYGNTELRALMDIKAVLDPQSLYLSSWTIHGDPCDSFEGVGCNKAGRVANISLQGKGLSGKLSPAIGELKDLTGIYMHYNSLKGEIPREIANLTKLSDLYLNVNNLSGDIPPEIGSMCSLEAEAVRGESQTRTNQGLSERKKRISKCIKLLEALIRDDLFWNSAEAVGESQTRINQGVSEIKQSISKCIQRLQAIIQDDSFFNLALKRLNDGFSYENNLGLCGAGIMFLTACNTSSHLNESRPEAFGSTGPTRAIPETANVQLACNQSHYSNTSKSHQASVAVVVGLPTGLVIDSGDGVTRDIYLTKGIKRRLEDDGIFFSCGPSSPRSPSVCGRDCHCGHRQKRSLLSLCRRF